MSSPYWQSFVAIESDLEKSVRYVELHRDNYATYSIEFAHILLACCSETEVICKQVCKLINTNTNPDNINDYRDIIHPHYSGFHAIDVRIPRYGLTLLPWQDWQQGKNPGWWRSYNKVKHERHQHFALANLENAINAVAGLFVAALYLYHKELRANILQPWPGLMSLNPEWNSRISRDARPGYILPDFSN